MQMNPTNCPRCQREFYTTSLEPNICCPFCEYSFIKTDYTEKRLEDRKLIEKKCVLSNGFGMITARAIDISEKGLGLVINGKVPFKKSDKLVVSLADETSWYQVKWLIALNGRSSKAGLKFLSPSLPLKLS